MATGVSNFVITSSGNNINYTITWEGFGCSINPQIVIRLFDGNRNAVTVSATFTSGLGTTGTINGTFTNIYSGLFRAVAIFTCNGSRVSGFTTQELTHNTGGTINPPPPSSEPPPVTNNPSSNGDFCIPTTGAVSMGDLNVVFGRTRSLANTLLSGPNNPSTSPSLFGISFLPNNVVSPGKLTPNAISEFRGYCHVEPIVPATISWSIVSNVYGTGALNISYIDQNGNSQSVIRQLNSQFQEEIATGSFQAKPGTLINITVSNFSFVIQNTPLFVQENATILWDNAGVAASSNNYQFIVKNGENGIATQYSVDSAVNGNDPFVFP